jgi:hypothetical protein
MARRLSVHAVCVAAYRKHRDDGAGCCAACGQSSPCQVRRNAGKVIEAYADVPGRYDVPDARLRLVPGIGVLRWGVLRG